MSVPPQNIRIRHTVVLDDPFDDPPQLAEHIPEQSPEPVLVEVGPGFWLCALLTCMCSSASAADGRLLC